MALVQHYRHVGDIGGFEVRAEKVQDMGQALDAISACCKVMVADMEKKSVTSCGSSCSFSFGAPGEDMEGMGSPPLHIFRNSWLFSLAVNNEEFEEMCFGQGSSGS